MPLRLLLDENISPTVAEQVQRHIPALVVESVHTWRAAAFKSRQDKELLLAAATEALTLVTYDQKTIPNILIELSAEGHHHAGVIAGVIFVDDRTVANDDFGLLTRSLISFWERCQDREWQDCVRFLDRPSQ